MQPERRFNPNWDHVDKNTNQPKADLSVTENQVSLFRYVHMNDEYDTQIFTFLLLPHLLCGLLDEAESSPFAYAQNLWTVRFQRGEAHLGVFLELKTANCLSLSEDHSTRTGPHHLSDQIQCCTVSLDFQFTLKNREHFSRNEIFGRKGSVFYRGQPRHGRKKFVELVTLSSKRHIFDDGLCVIELELKNPNVLYNLWLSMCADPTLSNHYDRNIPHSSSVISLMRLDGSLTPIAKSLHFESERFFYAESQWYLTLDLETTQASSSVCGSHSQRNLTTPQEAEIVVLAEMSLVMEVRKSTESKSRTGVQPKKCHTVSNRVKCIATLPGGCVTKLMEFSIGSQGWPTQAYRVRFRTGSKEETDGGTTQENKNQLSTPGQSAIPKSTTDFQSAGSGSPVALLLACASSPINVKLQMVSFTNLSFVEVSLLPTTVRSAPAYLSDPFKLPWILQTSDSGKLLRLKFQSVPVQVQWKISKLARSPPTRKEMPNPGAPNVVYLVGCRIRIHPLTPQLHAYVFPVGPELVELLRFTSDRSNVNKSSSGDSVSDERFKPTVIGSKMACKTFDSDYPPAETTRVDALRSSPADRSFQWTAVEQENSCEVAMNVTVVEASDKNTGLLNPMNGTILIEIEWVYHHVILIDRFHLADLINARQFHQMRYELNRLRKERDELERQLMSREMGLIQIDPMTCQGPRSMVPLESVPALRSSTEDDRSSLPSRSSAHGASSYYSRDQFMPIEQRVAKRRSHFQVQHREPRGSPHFYYQDSYGSHLDTIGRSEEHVGFVRGPPRYSFDNDSNVEEHTAMDNCSASRSSVNSDHVISRLPDRRKQFGRSKMTWKTYECSRVQSLAEPFPVHSSVPTGSAYWQRPPSRRVQQICSGSAKSATSSSGCSPRGFFQNYDDNAFFE
ncbi:hypothetical protein FGIG_02567 [Fasciola gigantica]|uniref:Uncharacterized protein n=1 Tax=Fasciola gigantica TaxID=46835 RepID=A0A504YV44_FASGI|nr:hypothetical protein FGIG_02567 [Fasciola gigantica]